VISSSNASNMGILRHGQEGVLALPWKMYKDLLLLQHFVSHKSTKIITTAQDMFHRSKYTYIVIAAGALPQTVPGELSLAVFKVSASQQRRKRGVDRAGGKRRGGDEWRDRGREGEKREEVDFTPSGKNFCGRP